MDKLALFGNIPIDYHTLASILTGYNSPADKISSLEKDEKIIRLKKGLFVVANKTSGKTISRELIANHLYGPSYISLEFALSWYGLIPERVHIIRSLTTKRTRSFSNPLGQFDYITTGEEYFPLGIRQILSNDTNSFLMASPEKALCDLIIYTPGLRIQSMKAMKEFLEQNLRIDFQSIENFDKKLIQSFLKYSKKKNELDILLKYLKQ